MQESDKILNGLGAKGVNTPSITKQIAEGVPLIGGALGAAANATVASPDQQSVEQAQRELAETQGIENVDLPSDSIERPVNPVERAQDKLLVIEKGSWANYTQQQLLAMTNQQFFDATAGMTPTEMPRELLVIAMQRKNS